MTASSQTKPSLARQPRVIIPARGFDGEKERWLDCIRGGRAPEIRALPSAHIYSIVLEKDRTWTWKAHQSISRTSQKLRRPGITGTAPPSPRPTCPRVAALHLAAAAASRLGSRDSWQTRLLRRWMDSTRRPCAGCRCGRSRISSAASTRAASASASPTPSPTSSSTPSGLLLHDQAKHPPPPSHQYPPPPEEHRQLVPKCLYASHVFMAAYFRYLSGAQARRYLSLASYDLLLAIKLVHHDRLTAAAAGLLLPDGGRLRVAATQAGHPAPDVLARLMTAAYPPELLSRVLARLRGTEPLSAHDVLEIKDLLARHLSTPEVSMEFWCRPDGGDRTSTCTRDNDGGSGTLRLVTRIGEDVVAHISIVRTKDDHSRQSYITDLTFSAADLEAKLSIYTVCLEAAMRAVPRSHRLTPVASPQIQREICGEDMVSLKLRLLDTIHAFYIKALAILPSTSSSSSLLRALVQAGHCYGPCDPVSNIVINSVWYSMALQEEDAADAQLPECSSIDARLLASLGSRSLDGLVAVVGSSSQHRALEILTDYNCQPPKHHDDMESRYHRAAQISKHPQAAAFCLLLSCVLRAPGDCLQRLLPPPGKRFSDANWDELNAMLARAAVPAEKEPPCSLSTAAPVEISKGKCDFRRQNNLHSFGFGASLNGLLRKYCYQHPWEPNFKLHIICGVRRSKCSSEFLNVPNFYQCELFGSHKRCCSK
ncbi:hypothetical protein BS78_03G033500 [Paspalum vaginatum]|nr:hypothetical protein BS78_03G033500 [Paspalum vaginatum]KAJ1282205.1 hypothetical protein BS78_03G033500 [Paspalum vaginatum]KAJ1282206.1 hypothetical protein BS78_03G033500 [Paspalum vaginatum]